MKNTYATFRNDTPRRMIGSETEYTTPINHAFNIPDALPEALIAYSDGSSDEVWLTNGARAYIDHGDLLEYATPECMSADELLFHEKAGEKIVSELIESAGKAAGEYKPWRTHKRSSYYDVSSPEGEKLITEMSAGHHENYESFFSDRLLALESYLATRAIWAGAGIVGSNGFEIHQKASAINLELYRGDPTQHGKKVGYSENNPDRLEIRLGDGNMSAWAIRAKFGLTSFVLRLIEHDEFPDKAQISSDHGLLMRYVSTDPSLEFTTPGGRTTPASHQRTIAQACLDFAEKHPEFIIPPDEIRAAEQVAQICDEIDEVMEIPDNLYLIADRIDWAAKLSGLHHAGIRDKAISTRNLDAVKIDLQWEEVGKHTASEKWFKKSGNIADPLLIEKAIRQPPDSRAKTRTNFLRSHSSATIGQVDWSTIAHPDFILHGHI